MNIKLLLFLLFFNSCSHTDNKKEYANKDPSHLLVSQSELFADLVSIIHFENPTVLALVNRDFSTKDFTLDYKSEDVHNYYAPIRYEIWELYQKSKLSKGNFLNRVLNAMIKNALYSQNKSLNQREGNISLLLEIEKELKIVY